MCIASVLTKAYNIPRKVFERSGVLWQQNQQICMQELSRM